MHARLVARRARTRVRNHDAMPLRVGGVGLRIARAVQVRRVSAGTTDAEARQHPHQSSEPHRGRAWQASWRRALGPGLGRAPPGSRVGGGEHIIYSTVEGEGRGSANLRRPACTRLEVPARWRLHPPALPAPPPPYWWISSATLPTHHGPLPSRSQQTPLGSQGHRRAMRRNRPSETQCEIWCAEFFPDWSRVYCDES